MVKRKRILLDHESEIKEYLGLIRFLAGIAFSKVKYLGCFEVEDFLQVGMLGALEGLRKFDKKKGKKSTYLYFRVKGKLSNLLRKIYRRRKVLQTEELVEESAVSGFVEDFELRESLLKVREGLGEMELQVFDCLCDPPPGFCRLVEDLEKRYKSCGWGSDTSKVLRKALVAYIGISEKKLSRVFEGIGKKFVESCEKT